MKLPSTHRADRIVGPAGRDPKPLAKPPIMRSFTRATLFVLCLTPAAHVFADSLPLIEKKAWADNFDTLNRTDWLLQEYSFPACGCNMVPFNVGARASLLMIGITKNKATKLPKPYNAGDLGTNFYFMHGLFIARIKPAAVKGGVTAFFVMNQWVPKDWEHKEIDFEILGKAPNKVQLTTHDFQKRGTDWKSSAETVDLPFDSTSEFHEYAILWTAKEVKWIVDGKLLRTTDRYVPDVPLQIRMNFYVGDMKEPGVREWLGPVDDSQIPAVATFDWVKYYPLTKLPEAYRRF